MKNQNTLPSLLFIKATAWVILGISGMFSVPDLTAAQPENTWLPTLIKFGLAITFLYIGISFQRNPGRAIGFLVIVVIVDIFFNLRSPIGIFDVLMLLFDVILYWLVFSLLKSRKLNNSL